MNFEVMSDETKGRTAMSAKLLSTNLLLTRVFSVPSSASFYPQEVGQVPPELSDSVVQEISLLLSTSK